MKRDIYFSTGFKCGNSPPYCRQLPALEKTDPAWFGTHWW